MDVVVAKIISLVAMTALTMLAGLLPMKLMQHMGQRLMKLEGTIQYVLNGSRCFSGGIFLATCFLHLIPETREKVREVMKYLGSTSQYPVAELLTMTGFYAILFMEQIIQILYRKTQSREDSKNADKCTVRMRAPTAESLSLNSLSNEEYGAGTPAAGGEQVEELQELPEPEVRAAPVLELELKRVVEELKNPDASRNVHIRSIVFIIALSFHGVFEGMTLGLQSLESNVWSLCFAIAVHRCILAFGLGLQLAKDNEGHGVTCLCVGCFSLILVLGIITGIAISSSAMLYSNVNVPDAILQSLATGTIFYIIFFDILFKDLEGHGDIKRISCTFVGFSLMAVLFAITSS